MGYMHIEDSLKLEKPMLLALETVKDQTILKKDLWKDTKIEKT